MRLKSGCYIAAQGAFLFGYLLVSGCPAQEEGAFVSGIEPGEWLPGGDTTNTLLLGANAFARPAENITDDHELMFFSGNSFFNQGWVTAPASTENRDGLGPLFNARSCAACHFRDGRGSPPMNEEESFLGILIRLSIPGSGVHGEPVPDPKYGSQLQPFSILDVPAEGRPSVRYEEIEGEYPDGEPYVLHLPVYEISELAYGEMDPTIQISPRVAPAVIGLGLLEAIPEDRLRDLEDEFDVNLDGISGKRNIVWDAVLDEMVTGRFGWKAEQPNVRQQAAGAFLGDIGITTSVFRDQNCTDTQVECANAIHGGEPEIGDDLLDRVEVYTQLLAVPIRNSFSNENILRGKYLFNSVGCANCHTPSHQTKGNADLVEVRNQKIWPYTDLLLHDMGEGLADGRPVYRASGQEWRTPPLWGLRLYEVVNGHDRLLHDGRARGVEEAILWHGGEADISREEFMDLPISDRQSLIDFVESL